jgi:lysophospholipase L1-like esterase
VAESDSRFDWVDTDDLNDGVNRRGEEIRDDLHMSADGYVILGKRFADTAITYIENMD